MSPFVLGTGCGDPQGVDPAPASAAPAITNRIPLPPEVIANLGITFERARRGRLETRMRIPGRVEIAPEARFTVRAPASGRLVLRVARWQTVSRGEVIGELLSEDLRSAQEALAEAANDVERADIDILRARAEVGPLAEVATAAEAALAAARDRERMSETALRSAQELEKAALARLESTTRLATDNTLASGALFAAREAHVGAQASVLEAAARRDEARSAVPDRLLGARAARARADTAAREIAILERRRATGAASQAQQVRALSVLTGIPVAELGPAGGGEDARWLRLETIPLRAPSDGVVTELLASDAEWVEAAAPVLRTVDPKNVVFRGEVPETDVARIPPEAEVRIETACAVLEGIQTKLEASRPVADPRTRTVLVEARLPRNGVTFPDCTSGIASVLLERSAQEETLLPAACVVQDELELVVFRRDPAKPDQVIRTPVSVGRRSEGWVEVLSEVAEGDEVVRDGVHQLRLTGIGKASATGHFHADGTWHDAKD